jgi:predicted CXXCH cytochrome family protein
MKNEMMMKKWFLPLALSCLLCFPGFGFGQKNSCLDCHSQLEAELRAPADAFKQDIHQQFGLGCVDCHGGNPGQDDEDLAKDKSFKGAPKRAQVPEFCASCHSNAATMRSFNPNLRVDQLSQYWTSRHGQLLKKGDTKVAVCTDCHGQHGIQSAKYPKSMTFPWNIPQTCGRCHASADVMKDYKIPTNQLDEYKQSVHANALFDKKDMSAPTCNSCHGNHGAFPPEVKSIASVCRQCHPSTGELFSKSPHKKAFDEMGMSECEACHGNHKILRPSNDMLGTGEKSVCLQCHESGSKGYQAAADLGRIFDTLQTQLERNEDILALAEKKGVEVSQPKFHLQDVNTILVSAKNLTHGLAVEDIRQKAAEGEKILADIRQAGDKALQEAKFRRTGLVIATAFLALFGLALFLKIRDMTKSGSRG